MPARISPESFSRIDKLLMELRGIAHADARPRRADRGLELLIGADAKSVVGLQLALLTAVNLGVRCFTGKAIVYACDSVWSARCGLPLARGATLGDAVSELGGRRAVGNASPRHSPYLALGDVEPSIGAIRVTYDGWCAAVGPASSVARLPEREYCPLSAIAAAALGVSEVFGEFARISVAAARRPVALSLWRPDLPFDHVNALGERLAELPCSLGAFGLGHLGQAYLWALASLPYQVRKDVTVLLCDDDSVESPNIETGALLTTESLMQLKTRVVAAWLEARGFSTRLLERCVDTNFRRTDKEPVIALCGFDDNRPRQWLADAGFSALFDSGLGGEAYNFDTIAYHRWPNPREASSVWPVESQDEIDARKGRVGQLASSPMYQALHPDECGRVLLAEKSVAVPFVGAVASCIVLGEMLKSLNGGPTFNDIKLRLCALGTAGYSGRLASEVATPIRGVPMQCVAA